MRLRRDCTDSACALPAGTCARCKGSVLGVEGAHNFEKYQCILIRAAQPLRQRKIAEQLQCCAFIHKPKSAGHKTRAGNIRDFFRILGVQGPHFCGLQYCGVVGRLDLGETARNKGPQLEDAPSQYAPIQS